MTADAPRFPPAVSWKRIGPWTAWTIGLGGLGIAAVYAYGVIAQLEDDGRFWPHGVMVCVAALITTGLAWVSYNEHTQSGPLHQARSNTAWYAMLLPAATALVFAATVEYPLPYP